MLSKLFLLQSQIQKDKFKKLRTHSLGPRRLVFSHSLSTEPGLKTGEWRMRSPCPRKTGSWLPVREGKWAVKMQFGRIHGKRNSGVQGKLKNGYLTPVRWVRSGQGKPSERKWHINQDLWISSLRKGRDGKEGCMLQQKGGHVQRPSSGWPWEITRWDGLWRRGRPGERQLGEVSKICNIWGPVGHTE